MDSTSHIAASLATAMRRALDVTANNIANADTAGFRAERVSMEAFVPDGAGAGAFVLESGSYVDMRQGALASTGNPLDVALTGPGWLAYQTPDGRLAYGRDGHLAVDAAGSLVTVAGAAVLDVSGAPITLPPDAGRLRIAPDGTISSEETGVLARIGVFDVDPPDAMAREAAGLFVPPEAGVAARPAEGTTLTQGALEGSNVVPVQEMTGLIEIQRAYERATRLMRTHDELARDAIRRAGRTT